MPELPFRIVTAAQAAQFRSATQGRDNALDPRKIDAGPYKDRYAFSENVMFNAAFADMHDIIRVAAPTPVVLDTDEVWPEVE